MNTDDTGSPNRREQGKALKAAREAAGLTQVELAGVLGITPQFLSMVENGRKGLSAEKLKAAAKYLGVRQAHLYDPARFPAVITAGAA